jgi:hypothetical protein
VAQTAGEGRPRRRREEARATRGAQVAALPASFDGGHTHVSVEAETTPKA